MARPAFVAAIDFRYFGVEYDAGDSFDDTGLNDLAIKRLLDRGYITAAGGGGGGGLTTEQIQDMISTFLVAGTNLSLVYDDTANTLTINAGTLNREQIEDILNASFVGTGAATVSYNDAANTFTVDVPTEAIQDIVGAMASAANAGIDVTYNDAGNAITFGLNTEYVQDLVGAFVAAGSGLTVTYNDAGNALSIALDTESVQDIVGALAAAGTGMTVTYNDAGNVLTLSVDTTVISTRTRAEAWAREVVLDGWTFRTSTTVSSTASGEILLNNSTMSSVTSIGIGETSSSANGLNANRATRIQSLRAGDIITLVDQSQPGNFVRFRVTSTPSDLGTYDTIPVAHISGTGFPLSDNAPVWFGHSPGSSDIPLSLFTTKGDLAIATASGAVQRHAAGADGTVPMFRVSEADGVANVFPPRTLAYSIGGTLTVQTGAFRIYNDTGRTMTIKSVRTSVGTAPTGASLIADVNKNGTTIFSTQANRPTIAASGNTSGSVTNMNVTSWANGEYITVDIDQIGSTIAGADFVFQMELDG